MRKNGVLSPLKNVWIFLIRKSILTPAINLQTNKKYTREREKREKRCHLRAVMGISCEEKQTKLEGKHPT